VQVATQEAREALRHTWAAQAQAVHDFVVAQTATAQAAVEGTGFAKMEDQLAAVQVFLVFLF
jgi:hypothetical protein